MTFNLAPASKKKVLTPNPDPARMLAVECEVAANTWLAMALKLTEDISGKYGVSAANIAFNKAVKYEQMAHDGRA